MILESNQNHATAKDTEVVNALPASMGMGGGYVPMVVESYGLITKGNGDVILSTEKHMSLSTGGGQAGQGYPCVLEPIGADLFNQTTTGTVSMTMSNRATDAHHIPCVIEPIVYSFIPRESQKTRSVGFAPNIAPTLNADGNCAVVEPIVVRDEMTIKVDTNGRVFALRGRDHKSVQCVETEDAESNGNA